jgi:hypothetical protein
MSYHLEATGEGSKGSVDSKTDLVLSVDPGEPSGLGIVRPRDTPPTTGDPQGLYPVVLHYSRILKFTDTAGRNCEVEVAARFSLSHETFRQATQFHSLDFETLTHLPGDRAVMTVKLHGAGAVQAYATFLSVAFNQVDLATLSKTAARLLGAPQPGASVISKELATFVQPELTPGEQFESLKAFLFSADVEEMGRRVMADLHQLEGQPVSGDVKRGKAKPSDDDGGGLLGSLLKATIVGLLVVGAIVVVAAIFGVSIPVAAATVLLTLAATAFVNFLKNRYEEGKAAGVDNPLSIISAAVLDTLGVSDIYQAARGKSVLTGRDLQWTMEQRVGAGIAGGLQFVMTFFGVRESVKGGVPGFGEADVPGEPGAPVPEPPAEPPGTLTPAVPAEPGRAPTVYRRRPTGQPRPEPYPIEPSDEPGMVDEETRDVLSGKRTDESEVPYSPEELESGFQNVDAPDRFHWSMTEEDLREFAIRRFRNLPASGWQRQPMYANGGRVRGRFPRRAPGQRTAYTKPEWFHPGDPPTSLEGKNWKIGTDIDDFVTNTTNQAITRQPHLPPNSQQHVIIDIRGQEVPQAVRQQIVDRLVRGSRGTLTADQIHFLE